MPHLKPGSRWRSIRCSTEIIVVRGPADPVVLGCGGSDMVSDGDATKPGGPPEGALASGTMLGKRYASAEAGVEVLCVKAGPGSLTVDGTPLAVKDAKPLPASD